MIATVKSIASELKVDAEGHRASILEYSSIAKLQKWPRYYFEHISVGANFHLNNKSTIANPLLK